MKTVFIADDEQNILEGLKYIIDWESLGFEICGEASNGEAALQAILTDHPSLVLLDIRMPKMYGTEIIRIARENGYKGKFIILSGYSDFSYAKTAISYGVNCYLTKPIDEDELYEAVLKIKNELDNEQLRHQNINYLKHKAKHVILHEIITGLYGSMHSQVLTQSELEEMNLIADEYQVVIYEKFSNNPEDTSYDFADLLMVTNKGNHTFEHMYEEGNEIILLKGNFALLKFQDFLSRYEEKALEHGSPLDSLFLAYGRPVKSIDEVYLSYEEALSLCNRRFFCLQGQHTLGYDELPENKSKNLQLQNNYLEDFCNRLTDYVFSFNRQKVSQTLIDLEDYLFHVKNDTNAIKLFLTDLYLQFREKCNYTYKNMEIPFPSNASCIQKIENCHYLYEIIQFISSQAETVMNATGNPSRDTILDDILYYIDHNYQANLKLESIAPLFGYSSAYLGKIFTKTTGENFNTYVEHKRIEHSKVLLMENNLKVYEIAEQVGYKNVDYFHKKFKKYVGISPAEYRKNMSEKE